MKHASMPVAVADRMPPNWTAIQALADSNLIGILIARPDGGIVLANDEFLRIVGYSRQELDQGLLNWRALTPPDWTESGVSASQSLETSGLAGPFEKEYLRKDGGRARVLIGIARLSGGEAQAVSFVVDLSQQKRAEQERDRLLIERAAVVDSVGDGIYGLDLDGRCNFINRAASEIWVIRGRNASGRTCTT